MLKAEELTLIGLDLISMGLPLYGEIIPNPPESKAADTCTNTKCTKMIYTNSYKHAHTNSVQMYALTEAIFTSQCPLSSDVLIVFKDYKDFLLHFFFSPSPSIPLPPLSTVSFPHCLAGCRVMCHFKILCGLNYIRNILSLIKPAIGST